MRRRRRKRTHLPSIDTAVSGSRFDGLSPVFQRHLLLVAPRAPTTSPEATYCCSPPPPPSLPSPRTAAASWVSGSPRVSGEEARCRHLYPTPIWGQRDAGPDHYIEVVVRRVSCPRRQDPPGPHGLKAGPPQEPAGAHKPCAASAVATQTRNDVGQSSCPNGPVSLP